MESRWCSNIALAAGVAIVTALLIKNLSPHDFQTCRCADKITSKTESFSLLTTGSGATIKDENGSSIASISMSTADDVTTKQYLDNCIVITQYSNANSRDIVHTVHSGQWYGGPQFYEARWPIDKRDITYQRYVSDDLLASPNKFGSILERYWLSTNGIAIYFLSDDDNLHYGVKDGNVVFGSTQRIEYAICKDGLTMKDTHLFIVEKFFKKPSKLPDTLIMKYPIWSTWVRYKTLINQSVVVSFAHEIKRHGFNASQIEIDDTYTTNYGDMLFDETRFPNPSQMIKEINKIGFRVTSWVHPFINVDTHAFQVNIFCIKIRENLF